MENNEKTSVSGSKWCVRVEREVLGNMWEFDGGYNPVVKKKYDTLNTSIFKEKHCVDLA